MYRLVSWQNGHKEYLKEFTDDGEEIFTTSWVNAWIVNKRTADLWDDLEREELSEAERMERAGVGMLPGLEARE